MSNNNPVIAQEIVMDEILIKEWDKIEEDDSLDDWFRRNYLRALREDEDQAKIDVKILSFR